MTEIIPEAMKHNVSEQTDALPVDVLDTTKPIGISGSSINPESTRVVSISAPPDLPYESIYTAPPLRPVTFPVVPPVGVAGSPLPAGSRSAGLGSSAYDTFIPTDPQDTGGPA